MHVSVAGEFLRTYTPIAIILTFTFIPLIIGSIAARNSISTVSDFFVMDRKMGTPLSFFTVYATWWSSFAYLGSTSYFYSMGSVYWTAIGWNMLFGILYMLIGRKVSLYGKTNNFFTPIQFFSYFYRSRILDSLIIVIMLIFTLLYLQLQLYGGAIIIEIATRGMIPWQLCALVFYLVMIIYLWAGGLRAVAWADVFYGVLIFCGLIAGGGVLIAQAGGVEHTFHQLIQQRPELILLPEHSKTSGSGMWISMFLILPIGAVMSPPMWARMYATSRQRTFSMMPLLLSLATIAYVGSMLAGSAAAILKPDGILVSDSILPFLLVEYAPGWLMAIIMCCGAAACLSTANSEIHAISAIISLDIYGKYIHPKATGKRMVYFAKISIVVFSSIAYFSMVFIQSPSSIVNTGMIALSGMAQLSIPTIGALVWKKSSSLAAITGMTAGIGYTLCFSLFFEDHFYIHPGLTGLIINIIVFTLCNMMVSMKRASISRI